MATVGGRREVGSAGGSRPRRGALPVLASNRAEEPTPVSKAVTRVGGLDTAFLSCETPGMHMHVAGLLLLEPSATEGDPYDHIRALLLGALPEVPLMHKRLAAAPFGVGGPFWVDDEAFAIDRHLHRVSLAPPGDDLALAELVGEVAGVTLRRDRPLWEAWFVDGLAGGRIALLAKMHHAIIDGVSGVAMMGHLFGFGAPVQRTLRRRAPWLPEPMPGPLQLLRLGALGRIRTSLEVPRLLPTTAARLAVTTWNVGSSARRGGAKVTPFAAPRTSFNATLTSRRSVAFADVALADVKAVKDAFGVKVNDVVASVVGGALRRYLQDRGELPVRPLVAAEPVAVHASAGGLTGVSKLSVIFSTLGTDVADPVSRLRLVAASNVRAKEVSAAMGADTFVRWTALAPPAALSLGAHLYSRLHVADRLPVVFNVLVSNVAGPPFDLYLAGHRVAGTYAFGPIVDGAGINVTVLSSGDRLGLGVLSCPDLVPDVWALADAVHRAFDELLKAARRRSRGPGPRP